MQDFTATVDCTLTDLTAGVCTNSFGGSAANDPGLSTTTLAPSDITFFPVTVTAGVLAGSTAAVAMTGTVSETGATPSSTVLTGTSGSAGAATSSTASNGAMVSVRVSSWMVLAFAFTGLALSCLQ